MINSHTQYPMKAHKLNNIAQLQGHLKITWLSSYTETGPSQFYITFSARLPLSMQSTFESNDLCSRETLS